MGLKSKPNEKSEQLEMWPDGRSHILPDGSEVPDPKPVALPVGFERPESIHDLIRRLVTDPSIRDEMKNAELESFDEADDFDIEDDVMVNSPHEDVYDPEHLLTREQEIMAGTVKPRTAEEVAEARRLIEEVRAKASKKPEPGSPPAASEAVKP